MFIALAAIALVQAVPDWSVRQHESTLDGRQHYLAGRSSSNQMQGPAGPMTTMLAFGCQMERHRVILTSPAYIRGERIEVTWKVGENEVGQGFATTLPDGRGVTLEPEFADLVFDQIEGEGQATFRIGSGPDMRFALVGADEHVEAARAMCADD